MTARTHVRQLVVLVKTDGVFGAAPLGAQHETRHPFDRERADAVRVAYARLKRDMPDENPMCWTVSGGNDG